MGLSDEMILTKTVFKTSIFSYGDCGVEERCKKMGIITTNN